MHKNLIRLLTSLLFAIIAIDATAQDITVSGTIFDPKEGEPVIGASVVVKGTKTGVFSDIYGNYTIKAPANGTLTFSGVGYKTITEKVNGRSMINVNMSSDSQDLDELVVVGYGVQRKSDVTGSISSVSGKEVSSVPTSSVLQALQGKASGVNIIQNSGAPG